MHQYFFIENKLVFFDVDIASHFKIDIDQLRNTYATYNNRFLNSTVFSLNKNHILTAEIYQGRRFEEKPVYAFTKSAIFVLSMIINTPEAIGSSMTLIKEIEHKEETDIMRALASFSNNLATKIEDDKDTYNAIKEYLKLLIIEVLTEIDITKKAKAL